MSSEILSQTDALSAETVEYTYDALNRLATAQTTGPQWGLAWAYDGFGNRTNQTVTKGSGPTHSVAIDASTNRIATAGYLYDANGNMTQMPLMTMGYDVANRMVTSNHSGAGTQTYGYNQANQRIFVRNGSTVTYYFYGMGGERLMEFQETCTGGACTSYQENQRWIYFAGRKMFSKTGSTLKAIAPDRLASEAKHFPYGETDGTPPSDTKDYFATYRRDGTGLDYAWNRYYSPTMGRFTTADPYGGSQNPLNPESWNRYSYTENLPVSRIDPTGLGWWDSDMLGGSVGDLMACLYSPWDAHWSWGWLCGHGSSQWSEEMLYARRWYALPNPEAPGGGGGVPSNPKFPQLSQQQTSTVSAAKMRMVQMAERADCDSALSDYGVASLTNVLKQLTFDRIYDGGSSSFPTSSRIPMSDFLSQRSSPGAIVIRPDGDASSRGNVLFLGPKFFSPDLVGVPLTGTTVVQAIVLMHEAIHLVSNVGDMAFATRDRHGNGVQSQGSLALTRLLVQKCYPIGISLGLFGGFYGGR